jgi:hypothetical protein
MSIQSESTARKFRYGKETAAVTDAGGVEGMLLRSFNGRYFFRVYHDGGTFTDYQLQHDDLSVVITKDALAAFYQLADRNVLDHSPEVLGLEEAKE